MPEWRLPLILVATFSCSACETLDIGFMDPLRRIEKDAKGIELQKETSPVTDLPEGCPTLTATVPPGGSGVTVSYKEPTTNADGTPLKDLKSTLIYVSTDGQPEKRIQVWTNDWTGGADVVIHNVDGSGSTLGLCVVAMDLSGNVSAPASPAR